MTQQISSEQEEKEDYAQFVVCCYGDSIEANGKLVQNAASSMEELDMAAFVQVSCTCIDETVSKSTAHKCACAQNVVKK